ncbi:sigma-54 interaction domain-containing protein [Paludibaculum fermentans]|uniref:sigma-54 interaction domain-containing protein n=1 Tax=Paludibaculum fermentans TaxID=1473598 RepID=UPI003EBEDC55
MNANHDSHRQPRLIEATFHQLPYPAFIYDNVGTIVAVNRAAEDLLGASSENQTGRSCSEIFHCRNCGHGCAVMAAIERVPATTDHTVHIRSNTGGEHLAFVKVSQLTGDAGALEGALAIFTCVIETSSPPPQAIVAQSHEMREILGFARRVAASEATTILLGGETGTGKELIARLLHEDSRRSTQPFVAINCAAMPETLLESELFGYEKGAFTDARSPKRGLFELADKGTLFLDEIGELPLKLQAKLLRVLEDRTFRRLGGLQDIHSDFRIVAASKRDLPLAVAEHAFRLDLYYRVNVIQLTIPPLRERRDDILPLARHFIERFSRKFMRNTPTLSPETSRLLLAYDWPGNARELRNWVERHVLLGEAGLISPDSLSSFTASRTVPTGLPGPCLLDQGLSLKNSEQLMISHALARTNGNQSGAARLLGISRDALRYRLKYGARTLGHI